MKQRKPVIFLSHSGLDAERATKLAKELKWELHLRDFSGSTVDVFNTSETQYRFRDLALKAGADFKAASNKYDEKLRAYLQANLRTSAAYVLLVTPKSLAADTKWIRFEIEEAYQKAKALRPERFFFFPCVADGAKLRELPGNSKEYQGIELKDSESFLKLVEALVNALREYHASFIQTRRQAKSPRQLQRR